MSPLLVSCAVAVVAGNAPILLLFLIGSFQRRIFGIDGSVVLISWVFGAGVAILVRAKGWI